MTSTPARRNWLVAGFIFALAESLLIWVRISAAPVAWIALVWTVFGLAAAGLGGSSRRPAWLNLAAIFAAIGLVEGALWLSMAPNPYVQPPGVRLEGSFNTPRRFIEMPALGLGYRPRPSAVGTSRKTFHGGLVYDVSYSVDGYGLRRSPPVGARADACLLMFGDSFAWGEGVGDQDTAAYQAGLLGGGRLAVRNFAFTGYGPHQMLWQVSSGLVAKAANCDPSRPVLAVYQTLPNNVGRVAGLRGWDTFGPRYRLRPDGGLVYAGAFDAGDSILHDRVYIPAPWSSGLKRLELYNRILGQDRRLDAFDRTRFTQVVSAAARALRTTYPDLRFLVVVWPDLAEGPQGPGATRLIDGLRQAGLEALPAGELLPGYDAAPWSSHIVNDGHLTVDTHRRLAQALLAREASFLRIADPSPEPTSPHQQWSRP